MPSRNVIKDYVPDSYYHIYNRGVAKQNIFVNRNDYVVFLDILKRYLASERYTDKFGNNFPSYYKEIELLAFCLMPNHFHLLVYQNNNEHAITNLIRSACTAYTLYFNRTHERVGTLFQGRFRASRITSDEYLQHISRYIHLNPTQFKSYEWSSLPYYLGQSHAEWIKPERVLNLFQTDSYPTFVEDYRANKAVLDDLKHELANTI